MMNRLQRKKNPSSHMMLFGLKMMRYLMLMPLELCHQKERKFKHHPYAFGSSSIKRKYEDFANKY